jgi:hypothetical protein
MTHYNEILKIFNSIDNLLLRAQILVYLINNKKISKIFKSYYIKYLNELITYFDDYYHSYNYTINAKSFFNNDESSNNIIPHFNITNDYSKFVLTLNFIYKNKFIIEKLLDTYKISYTEQNFKNIKKILNGKLQEHIFDTEFGELFINHEDLKNTDLIKKNNKKTINIELQNIKQSNSNNVYPLVFTYIQINGSDINFLIYSEEDIMKTPHFVFNKNKINKLVYELGLR